LATFQLGHSIYTEEKLEQPRLSMQGNGLTKIKAGTCTGT